MHSSSAFANYARYYQLVNKAEETFVTTKDKSCYRYYDSAFKEYKLPYLKDAYIAAEIAFYLKDTTKFLHYLGISFRNGLPLSSVRSAPMLRHINQDPVYSKITALYESNKSAFKVDAQARNAIWLLCHESDSLKCETGKKKSNVPASERRQKFLAYESGFREYIYTNYLSKDIFPNERIIGVATDSLNLALLKANNKVDVWALAGIPTESSDEDNNKIDYELLAKYSLSVMIHSKCSFWKYREHLWNAVLNGYMQPKEYAILHVTSTIWNQTNDNPWDDCTIERQGHYYYVMPEETRVAPDFSAETMAQIEKNRAAVYLQKYSVDEQKKQMQQETGIWFFYDFQDRQSG
ncbi:hypothetical protein DN068_20920 [Taibaiella soli]|uniref:Uncharacterized protein n=1 Tax=Taibaiella soli TaxID=1649169 RepID=A0A2W2A6J8_9BACT|nr:hypothetical protein DN068_20920 [Taibaiella soli]